MNATDISILFLFPLGILVGWSLTTLVNLRKGRVPKEHFDSACRQRDECLAGWNDTIAKWKNTTTALEEANTLLKRFVNTETP